MCLSSTQTPKDCQPKTIHCDEAGERQKVTLATLRSVDSYER